MSIEAVAQGTGFGAISIGNMGDFKGKVFLQEQIKATSMEISFTSYEPGQTGPFFHSHKAHEEVYMVIQGSGVMQLDEELIPLNEGTIVRVGPAPSRNIKNTGNTKMIVICAQAQEGSLVGTPMTDGVITETTPKY